MTDVLSCTRCPLHKELPSGSCPVAGGGNSNSKIMFISDFASKSDILASEFLSDRCGKYFDKVLSKAQLSREKIYVSGLLHCRPVNKNKERQPTKAEIDTCKIWIWKEIQAVNPSAIVTLGMLPTKALGGNLFKSNTKLTDIVGEKFQLTYHSAYLFPCYHPKYVMTRNAQMENDLVNVIKQAKDFVDGPGLPG